MDERYADLRVADALRRKSDYVSACKELVVLLKEVYSVGHKSLRAALFQDVILAFRILLERRWSSAGDLAAAQVLLQACESILPKQKKTIAVAEHRTAVIHSQRNSKCVSDKEEGCATLPEDVLIHVFTFLDGISLATAGCVCRAWHAASKTDELWRESFLKVVGNIMFDNRVLVHAGFQLSGLNSQVCKLKDITIESPGSWKTAFELVVKDSPELLYLFSRALCVCCKATFWPSELPPSSTCKKRNSAQTHKLKPLLPEQVCSYVLFGKTNRFPVKLLKHMDSDSDEDHSLPYAKLWEYARYPR